MAQENSAFLVCDGLEILFSVLKIKLAENVAEDATSQRKTENVNTPEARNMSGQFLSLTPNSL